MGFANFNDVFNTIIMTAFKYNFIFYIVAIIFIITWVAYTTTSTILESIGMSSIKELLVIQLNMKEKTASNIIGIIGTIGSIGMVTLYIALCNTCYINEYYTKNGGIMPS